MKFRSSRDPAVEYTVTQSGELHSCDCPGFQYRGKCRHVEESKHLDASVRSFLDPNPQDAHKTLTDKDLQRLSDRELFDILEGVKR